MTSFDDRDKSFENKFARDEELQFKAIARRNKLAGLWAAEKLGLSGDEAQAYAKDVVVADFDRPGDGDVVEKILGDFQAKGLSVTAEAIQAELNRLLPIALTQIREG